MLCYSCISSLHAATAGAALDIYAFGILMAELVMGPDIVYLGVRPGELLQRVAKEELRPEIPTYIPADYRQVLDQGWMPTLWR
jgi:hypothetical protein